VAAYEFLCVIEESLKKLWLIFFRFSVWFIMLIFLSLILL
jgi:hypothetical protein